MQGDGKETGKRECPNLFFAVSCLQVQNWLALEFQIGYDTVECTNIHVSSVGKSMVQKLTLELKNERGGE